MEEFFENKVLNDLYETRRDGFEVAYLNKYGEPEELKRSREAEEELTNLIKNIAVDEETRKEIMSKLNDFEASMLGETCFWNEQYYKFGFADSNNLKEELHEVKEDVAPGSKK